MLKDYLVVAQEALSAQKEIYQVKQQRLELAQQEYQQLHAVWEHKLGSQVSCEYLPPPLLHPCTTEGKATLSPAWLASQGFSDLPVFVHLCFMCKPPSSLMSFLLVPCSDSCAIFIPCLSLVCSRLRLPAGLQTSSCKALQRLGDVGYGEFFNGESFKWGG